ncbi:helix-turn-helix transcriptional regulator [Gelidibacter mesophilus]|uniref:helix-turn-helix transcriptional regulator n=1 Tax=Gelidibacter mesophilus TaxID=169050 RepID=UPI00042A4540|nr:AraC family transcriptional regulator [Gelidibacter mesophilus]
MNDAHSFEIREGCTKNDRHFKGAIQRNSFTEAIEFYSFDGIAQFDFSFHLISETGPLIYMFFNLAHQSTLVLNCNYKNLAIPAFASVMMLNSTSDILSLHFESQSRYDFLIVKIQQDQLNVEQQALFRMLKAKNSINNILNPAMLLMPNLEICEIARKLKSIDKATCNHKFIAQGYCNILIGLKLNGLFKGSNKMTFLQPFEIQQLKVLSDEIIENPQHEYSIKELCKRTGLSVSKLQLGFKEMHHCTVAIFIRNQRLEKALDLLKNTNMNVSEIVYSIGLTNKSYFCRIFKKRFKCTPKLHQQKLKETLLLDV